MEKGIMIHSTFVYANPALDNSIEGRHRETMKKAALLGATIAAQGTLRPDTDLNVVIEPIRSDYDTLIALANKENEGYLSIAQGKLDIEKLETENEAIASEIPKAEAAYEIEKYRLGVINIPSIPLRQFVFGFFLVILILFMDAYLLGSAFQQTGSGLLVSIFLGIATSVSIAVLATIGTAHAQKISSPLNKFIVLCGLGILVGGSVYFLCEMRSLFYTQTSGQDIGAWKQAVLSILAFVAFHYLWKHLIGPAYTRMKERREAKDKLATLKKLEDRCRHLSHKYSENLRKINEVKQFRLAILAYAKSVEITVTRLYLQSVAEFKRVFVEQSAMVPQSFSNPVQDLTRFYDSIILTPTSHEKPE